MQVPIRYTRRSSPIRFGVTVRQILRVIPTLFVNGNIATAYNAFSHQPRRMIEFEKIPSWDEPLNPTDFTSSS